MTHTARSAGNPDGDSGRRLIIKTSIDSFLCDKGRSEKLGCYPRPSFGMAVIAWKWEAPQEKQFETSRVAIGQIPPLFFIHIVLVLWILGEVKDQSASHEEVDFDFGWEGGRIIGHRIILDPPEIDIVVITDIAELQPGLDIERADFKERIFSDIQELIAEGLVILAQKRSRKKNEES